MTDRCSPSAVPFPPQPSAEGCPSLFSWVHRYYGTVRLLQHVRVRIMVYGLRGPALAVTPRRVGDLPVLLHVVCQRARVLRLRRTGQPLACNAAAVLPSSYSSGSRHPDLPRFRSSIARPTNASVYASNDTSRGHPQDSRSGWIRYFLSCRDLHPYNMSVYPGARRVRGNTTSTARIIHEGSHSVSA